MKILLLRGNNLLQSNFSFSTCLICNDRPDRPLYKTIDWARKGSSFYVIEDPQDPTGILYLKESEYKRFSRVATSNEQELVVLARLESVAPVSSDKEDEKQPSLPELPSDHSPLSYADFFKNLGKKGYEVKTYLHSLSHILRTGSNKVGIDQLFSDGNKLEGAISFLEKSLPLLAQNYYFWATGECMHGRQTRANAELIANLLMFYRQHGFDIFIGVMKTSYILCNNVMLRGPRKSVDDLGPISFSIDANGIPK